MHETFTLLTNLNMWSWLSIGIILIVLELVVPGTYMVWFGLGALLTGLFVAFFPVTTLSVQLLAFAFMSVLSTIFGFFIYAKIFGKNKETEHHKKTGAERFIGQRFIVAETIRNGKGKITVGDSVWIALSDKTIQKGTEVVVTDVKGTQLVVE